MSEQKFRSFPFRSFPKENTVGTNGINEVLIPVLPVSVHSQNTGNGRERTGTNENSTKPKPGMFFHWCDESGDVENQGQLLTLGADGHGTARMFEWFTGSPSDVIRVTPDYLRNCIFYTSAAAMNAAYDQWEADHD